MLVHHFLENSASRLADKVALVCGDQRLSYREINQAAERLASGLHHLGVTRGDRVVILLDNCSESVIGMFGILKAGGIFVMLNPTMKSRKLSHMLRDCGAKALITHGNKAAVVREAVTDAPDLQNIIWVGSHSPVSNGITSVKQYLWEEVLSLTSDLRPPTSGPQPSAFICSNSASSEALLKRSAPNAFSHEPGVRVIDLDLATILYTSGSTGEPRGVMCAHYNMVSVVGSIARYLGNTEEDVILNVLPLSFGYGLYQILTTFAVGGTVVIEKSFVYPYRVLERMVKERATGFPLVPTIASILLQLDDLSKLDLSSLRYVTNAAAALPVAYVRRLRELLPQVKIYSMYGLTECTRASYLPPDEIDRRPDSVGIPIPNEEVFVVDGEGKEVGPNELGELVVRGSNVMQGYWNAPEETARRFRPGRYRGETLLYTGDLFRRDEEGFLYFVSRKDDMIKTKGERVSPKEIENALCEMEGAVEAAVIGVPDEILGQAIKAFVVAEQGKVITEMDVVKYCTRNLEPFMVPRYVEFRVSLPKTPNGKIDKKALQ